jgi:subtilase family serine protease
MNALWQQAAAQGISVLVSSGDSGAAGCDPAGSDKAASDPGVNAFCSSPYSTCVGGTQFSEGSSPNQYWSPRSDPVTHGSALGYIPEVARRPMATAMTHIAIQEKLKGKVVEWMEHVTDDQIRKGC